MTQFKMSRAAGPQIVFAGRLPKDPVYKQSLAGVRRYASAHGWSVGVVTWAEARTGTLPEKFGATHPLGFVVEGSDLPADLPPSLYGGAPVVFVNCTGSPRARRFARIDLDEAAVARTAFRELSAGHPSAYAVVGFRLGPRHWSRLRARAFREAAAETGLECRAFDFPVSGDADPPADTAPLVVWLAALPRHTAIFVVNDDTAIIVAESARKAGRAIPRDLTLIGADNDPDHCEKGRPTLSSVQLDFESAGFLAARLLDETISHRDTETRRNKIGNRPYKQSIPENLLCGSVPPCDKKIGPLFVVRRESTRGSGRRGPRILEAVETIRREACDGLTVGALAARMPGSRRLFELRFREATGHSVLDEILHVRLEKALTLLAHTDVPLSAIADFCGFNSDRALRKLFRARERMSMTDWRNLHRR